MKTINKFYIHLYLLVCTMLLLASCQDDVCGVGEGGLMVRLQNVSPQVITRSTPAELGMPDAKEFMIGITNEQGRQVYKKSLTTERIPLAAGKYSVDVTYGTNPLIAAESPYYVGSAEDVEVTTDEVTECSIKCKVANALVSARFGRDADEHARFDRHYSTYSIRVHAGKNYGTIHNGRPETSIYFRAGSSVSIEFYGVLKGNGQQVSKYLDLSGTDFPEVFQAADHAIVTLSLPDPQSNTAIDIHSVELVKATIEHTIPISWLALPQPVAAHQYDSDGTFLGTNISFGKGYQGVESIEWKAVVTNSADEVVRTVQGMGTLASNYNDSNVTLPYLPADQYKVEYFVMVNGEEQSMGSKTFTLSKPNVQLRMEGYSSYTKYLEGDIEAANKCDAFTIYTPKAVLTVSNELANNPAYTTTFQSTYNDSPISGTISGNTCAFADMTGLTPSFTPYTISTTAQFADVTLTGQVEYRITGLPASFAPPSQAAGWTGQGTVAWNDSDNGTPRIRLGQNAWSQPHSVSYNKFAIPAGTKVNCPYRVTVNGATVQTTLTLTLGNYKYFEEKSTYMRMTHYESNAVFTVAENTTDTKANSSYGSGQTKSWIYSLSYYYAE